MKIAYNPILNSSRLEQNSNLVWNLLLLIALANIGIGSVQADVQIHPMFGNDMVIQRNKEIQVWGTADSGEKLVVSFGEQKKSTQTDQNGIWSVKFMPLAANSAGQSLVVVGQNNRIELTNILVGDVWLCGGQSNMEFSLERIYQGDIEIASAHHPEIRLMTVPNKTSPKPLNTFTPLNEFNSWTNEHEIKGTWQVCSPETVKRFASIGYIFARRLHLATGIPIGIIDNSVGGTTVEGWTSRSTLGDIEDAAGLLDNWDTRIANWNSEKDLADRIERWKNDTKRRKERGEKPRAKPDDLRPGPAFDRNNPGASFNAMLHPLSGLKLSGIIFHQGYNNALGDSRPNLYAKTIKAMIGDWRSAFGDSELPFGIIELCAGADPQTPDDFEIRMVDAGPFIREAQFKAYTELKNMGWACAYDQQVNWYHPQMKVMLAERIARWALATQYEMSNIGHAPARLLTSSVDGNRITITFDRELTVRDGRPIAGMAIAASDQRFFPADAKFSVKRKDNRGRDVLDFRKIEVTSPLVETPVAVRYAWARCPLGNLTNRAHHERIIPVPSFRTDQWDWPEAPFGNDNGDHRRTINKMRQAARGFSVDRKQREAARVIQEMNGETN